MKRFTHAALALGLLISISLIAACEKQPSSDDANPTPTDAATSPEPTPSELTEPPTSQPDAEPVEPDRSPEAVAILESARDACLDTTSARYSFTVEGTLMLRMVPRMTGRALLSRVVDTWDSMIFVHTEMGAAPGSPSERPATYIVASDGTVITGVSDRTMLYYEGDTANGAADIIPSLGGNGLARPFIDKDPFKSELNATVLTHLGEYVADGHVCDLIEAHMPGQDPDRVRWAIDRETSLPRMQQAVYPGDEENDTLFTLTIDDLQVNEPVDPSMFYVEPPAGYEVYRFVKPIANGSPIPEWSMVTPDGERVSSADVAGKIVLLYFWKCESTLSRVQMPEIEWLRQEYGGADVEVILVSFAEREGDDPVSLSRARGWTGTLLINGDELAEAIGVPVVPTLVVIDRDQTLNVLLPRFRSDKRQFLTQTLDRLLAQ